MHITHATFTAIPGGAILAALPASAGASGTSTGGPRPRDPMLTLLGRYRAAIRAIEAWSRRDDVARDDCPAFADLEAVYGELPETPVTTAAGAVALISFLREQLNDFEHGDVTKAAIDALATFLHNQA